MFYPLEALQVERVQAADVLHVYKPIRAGQFRGQPWLTTVLAKLYELEQYTDAEIVRKKISAMITGFIKQVSPDNPVMTPDQPANGQSQTDPGTQISKLEPGTFPVLGFGEEVQFADAQGQRRLQGVRARRAYRPSPAARASRNTRSAGTSRGSTTPRFARACWSFAASANSTSIRSSSSRSAIRFIAGGCGRRCWRWCSASNC